MIFFIFFILILSEGGERETSELRGRKEVERRSGRWIKQTEVCVYQELRSWHADPGSIDTLRSAGMV